MKYTSMFVPYTTTDMASSPSIEVLNDLMGACSDCAQAYHEAHQAVDDERLAQLFREYEERHEGFGSELVNFATSLNAEPDPNTSFEG
ncbi:MAG: DUF2383 domain-containing protein, partial [Anaerolineae bacterium]|nr:DUF2383 domain-containing protein [Anaerolineae bacterium]